MHAGREILGRTVFAYAVGSQARAPTAGNQKKTMKIMMKSVLPVVCLLAAIPTLPGASIPTRAALQKQDIALLQRVEETANDVLTTSERLDSYNHVPNEYSRECHMYQLEALKEQIN